MAKSHRPSHSNLYIGSSDTENLYNAVDTVLDGIMTSRMAIPARNSKNCRISVHIILTVSKVPLESVMKPQKTPLKDRIEKY